jgi:prepilin signal peptidase PulO-like enzyme (type II secretory pathway)
MHKYAVFRGIYIFFSIYLAFLDARTGYLPRLLLWGAIAASCLGQFFLGGKMAGINAILGCALGLLIFSLAFFISGKKLGLADVWYAGLLGSVLGPVWWYPAVFAACLAALLFAVTRRRRSVRFIPFMAGGGILALLIGWDSVPGGVGGW